MGIPFQGHTSGVNSVAFSPDGRHIVSGSYDRTIQIWDAQTGAQVGNPLQGHTDSVNSVAFSPDRTSHIIASSTDDKIIQVCNAQAHGQIGGVGNKIMYLPIKFSSSRTHALQQAQSLFNDLPDFEWHLFPQVNIYRDGWIVTPHGKLLLWVPPSYRPIFWYSPWTKVIIPRGVAELDLSRMKHGPAWQECYSNTTMAT